MSVRGYDCFSYGSFFEAVVETPKAKEYVFTIIAESMDKAGHLLDKFIDDGDIILSIREVRKANVIVDKSFINGK